MVETSANEKPGIYTALLKGDQFERLGEDACKFQKGIDAARAKGELKIGEYLRFRKSYYHAYEYSQRHGG